MTDPFKYVSRKGLPKAVKEHLSDTEIRISRLLEQMRQEIALEELRKQLDAPPAQPGAAV